MRTTLLLVIAPFLSYATPQWRPRPPPDACFRRNDTLPACPYGGQCTPTANYTCQTACVNYQTVDNRFFCTLNCGYKATTISGIMAPNPLLCLQPTVRNGLTCESGWACYRQFGSRPPLFRSQGPVCSPSYAVCDVSEEKNLAANATSKCGIGMACMTDPRVRLAKPFKIAEEGICVPTNKSCSGKTWNECGETGHCVSDARCTGRLGVDCRGLCLQILGPTWETVNGTAIGRRWVDRGMC